MIGLELTIFLFWQKIAIFGFCIFGQFLGILGALEPDLTPILDIMKQKGTLKKGGNINGGKTMREVGFTQLNINKKQKPKKKCCKSS